MVRICDFPGCRNKNLSDSPYVFHRLPVIDLPLRQLWLLSMGLSIETRLEKVKRLRVCSAHFGKDDYVPARPEHRKKNVLRSDAVPGFQQLPGTTFWNTETGPEPCSWDAVEEKPLLMHSGDDSYENTRQHQPTSYEHMDIKTEGQSIKQEVSDDSYMPLDDVVFISDDDDVEDKVKVEEMDSTTMTTEEHHSPHEMTRTKQSEAVVEEGGQESHFSRDNLWDKMTTTKESKAVADEDDQESRFCRDDLWRFIKKFSCDRDMNVSSELFVTTEVIEACALHPFCIYLFVGVKFINGQRLSLVLIGYYDQNREASVVRPLGSLQLSYDSISPHPLTDWCSQVVESDSHLLIQMLNMSGLNLNNLAIFYSDAPKPKTMVSMLRGINPSLISLCRIPKMAAGACQAGISASFACVMDLLKDLHQHFSDCSNWGNTLDTLYADLASFNPAHPIAQQCLLVICIVCKMAVSWGEMLDYFKTLPTTEQTQRIQAQLMDAKIQLHFLFLCHALEPLQTLLEIQQSGNLSLDAELQQASILVHFYACSIFQPSEIKSFIGRRSLMALSMDNKLLPVTDVSIGFRAFAFLLKTSTVDLPDKERSDFFKNAMLFYRTTLRRLSKSIPEQLGDAALKIIGTMLKHTDISDIPGPVMSELAVQLGLVSHGSQEALQLPHKQEKFLSTLLSKFGPETCSWAKSLCLAKTYPTLHNLLLSILVMPRSLRKKKVLAQVVFHSEALSSSSEAATVSSRQLEMNRDMSPDQPSVSKAMLTAASTFDHIKTEQASESESSEMEESNDTDNSSDVVESTEKSAFSQSSMFESPTQKFEGIDYVAPIEEDEEIFFTPSSPNSGGQTYDSLEEEPDDTGGPPPWPGVVALGRKEDEPRDTCLQFSAVRRLPLKAQPSERLSCQPGSEDSGEEVTTIKSRFPSLPCENTASEHVVPIAIHHSIIPSGGKLGKERCTTCCRLFHCPLCPPGMFKPCQPAKLQRHLDSHMRKAITYEDKTICRCNLNCRNEGHFHCPICDNTILRRKDMKTHLKSCPIHQTSTAATGQAKQSQDSSDGSIPPLPPHIISPSLEPTTSAQETQIPHSSLKRVTCPICSLTCRKRNLAKHIQRTHPKKSKDVTETNHLKSVCVDATKGIFAVQSRGHDFSVPIHVRNETQGGVHKVRCELEECEQYSQMAPQSGFIFTHCEHIRSLRYCTDAATEKCLREEVLLEMVHLKVFSDSKKSACIKRQKYAQAAQVPLCVEVSFQESSKYFWFSVYEPTLYHYSRLGRIFVTYNSSTNTWHCPCARPRVSCVHKNISKWHFFQTNPDVFKTEETSTSTPKKNQDTVYPPSEEVLKQLVDYIYRQKNLPVDVPADGPKA